MSRRQGAEVLFGSVERSKTEDLKIYNAQVFNVSIKEENDLYLAVMRQYGPLGAESTIKPPETFFSSKDSALFVWVEWMGEKTYKEEFLGEASQVEKDLERFGQETEESTPAIPWSEKSIVSLSERLSEVLAATEPETTNGTSDE